MGLASSLFEKQKNVPLSEVTQITEAIARDLNHEGLVFDLYVFGSFAEGRAHQHSDLDLAIIANSIDELKKIKSVIAHNRKNYKFEIDFIFMTQKDLTSSDHMMGQIVSAHGVKLNQNGQIIT